MHGPPPLRSRRWLRLVAALPLPMLVGLWALWRLAPRRKPSLASIRGPKPTATFRASLREASATSLSPTENVRESGTQPRCATQAQTFHFTGH